MREAIKAGILGSALVLFLSLAWAHAAGAGNGFRRLPDVQGPYPNSLVITRTQVLVTTSKGLFIRPLGGSTWTPSIDTGAWKEVLPLLPNGDTLLAVKDQANQVVLSTNGGQSWAPVQCPGIPLLLCRSGFFCRARVADQDAGLFRSRDLGKSWSKLSTDTVTTLAVWKDGIAGVNTSGNVFKMDPATGAGSPLNSDLPSGGPDWKLFNVGDSLFALTILGDRLFKCQAGNEHWIPVLQNEGLKSLLLGHSQFGITHLAADSLFWSRDYGETWRPYPAPLNAAGGIAPEEGRLWAPTNPLQRLESDGVSWVADVAGMPGVIPWEVGSNGNRLFANSSGTWYQSASPDSAWEPELEPEGMAIRTISAGHSVFLVSQGVNHNNLLRIDSDGRRTVYPNPDGTIQRVFGGSRDRIYVSYYTNSRYNSGSFKFASPIAQAWTELKPAGKSGPMDWFAMDGDRIVTGFGWPPFYSADGGDT